MGVAAQCKLRSAVRDNPSTPGRWVVFQHEDEVIIVDAFQRLLDIAFLREAYAVAVVL